MRITIALIALAISLAGATAAHAGPLTAGQARQAAEDRITDRIGADGTLDSLWCTGTAKRVFTCTGAGTMIDGGDEHGFKATATVRRTCVKTKKRKKPTCRIATTLKLVHAAKPSDDETPSAGGGGDHNH